VHRVWRPPRRERWAISQPPNPANNPQTPRTTPKPREQPPNPANNPQTPRTTPKPREQPPYRNPTSPPYPTPTALTLPLNTRNIPPNVDTPSAAHPHPQVSKPDQFDVMVAPNLYGNLVANVVAGGLGGGPRLTSFDQRPEAWFDRGQTRRRGPVGWGQWGRLFSPLLPRRRVKQWALPRANAGPSFSRATPTAPPRQASAAATASCPAATSGTTTRCSSRWAGLARLGRSAPETLPPDIQKAPPIQPYPAQPNPT
jgi:hypothetical protein